MVSGSLRATDTLYSTTAQFQILRAPTASNGTTYGPGTANNLLKSNGNSVYWTTLAASDIPNLNTSKLTEGVLGVARGGTGSATTGVNTVFAGPSSGTANAAPNFRALVSADIPTLSITDKTSGTLTVPRGGTGAADPAGARANLGVKALQNNVSSPTANGNSISYIDTISQNNQGVISATKKTIPEVTQNESGLMIPDDKIKLDDIGTKKQVKTVSIEPVQDLHGYDNPWPAGGGTNKFDGEASHYGVSDSGLFISNTTYCGTGSNKIAAFGNTVTAILYGFNFTGQNTNIYIGQWNNDAFISRTYVTGSLYGTNGVYATFTIDSNATHVFFYVYNSSLFSDITSAKWLIKQGTGAEEWTPYSNICPISGWTGANVTACGVNIFNPDASTYEIFDLNGHGVYRYGHSYPPGTYTIINNTDYDMYYRLPTKDLSNRGTTMSIYSTRTVVVTVDADHILWLFMTSNTYDSTNCMVAVGTETAFKAYQGETYPISWQAEAGTVYGGTLDVTTGLLTVDRASVSLTGDAIDANWSDADKTSIGFYMSANNWRRTNYPTPVVAGGLYDYCKIGTVYNSDIWWNARMLFTSGSFNRFEIRIPKNVLSSEDLAGGRAYLNAHPLQAVYKIAPQTYQLTPTEILLLTNEDNVWADTGEVTLQSYFTNNATNVVGVIDVSHGGTGVTTIANIQAGKDGDGNTISSTYLKLSGGTMHGDLLIQKSGGSNVQVGNTDTGTHCLLIASTGGAHGIYSSGYWNGSSYVVDGEWLICRTQGGNITINGDCTGNAATATKATQDSDGNTIKSTYLKLSGGTMTGTLSVNRTSDGEEANVEAKSAAGSIYLYSEGTNTGSRGIHAVNAAGTSVPVIGITQDNQTYFYGLASQNVFRSGDTMTGNLTVQKNSEAMIRVKNTAIGVDVAIDSKSDGNHGIWSYGYWDGSNYVSNEKWMLYRDTDGKIRFNDVIDVAHGGTGATTGNGACENINAVNSKTDSARRITSGSVNDAALGMVSYAGQNDAVTQKPYNSWFDVFTFKSVETNYTRQIAVPWFNNRSIAFRVQSNGTWSSWRYIATQTTEPTA